MKPFRAAVAAIALATSAARAEGPQATGSATVERHFTTNALDGPIALDDWYSLLRGTAEALWTGESGSLKVGLEAQAKRYDTYDFEDDHQLALTVVGTAKIGDRVELRGTLTGALAQEGDDLMIDGLLLSTWTRKSIVGAAVEAGVDLAEGRALVLAVSARHERPGPTLLADQLELQLDPDVTTLATSASFSHRQGALTRSVTASVKSVDPAPIEGVIVAVPALEFSLSGELRRTLSADAEIAVALGLAWLRSDGFGDEARPIYALSLKAPVGPLRVRAGLRAFYEYADTDDPLASFLQRAEVEAALPLTDRVTLGAGLFAQLKDNLLLGFDERAWGVYAEVGFVASSRLTLAFRTEWDRKRYTVDGLAWSTLDSFVRLKAAL